MMIAHVIGTTRCSTDGAATLSPSIAESTEIAGVIMLSPKKSDAPKTPAAASTIFVRRPPGTCRRRINAISDMMPPSPSLSARITSMTYVTVTMITTDQKISEMIPNTLSVDAATGCGSLGLKTVWTVYRGLVPMSPKTTPSAPSANAACAVRGPAPSRVCMGRRADTRRLTLSHAIVGRYPGRSSARTGRITRVSYATRTSVRGWSGR